MQFETILKPRANFTSQLSVEIRCLFFHLHFHCSCLIIISFTAVTSHAPSACCKECEARKELQLIALGCHKGSHIVGRLIEMLINEEQQ
jgi:hypothetical protein